MPDMDALAEMRYSDTDPQFANPEPMRDEGEYLDDLSQLEERLDDCDSFIRFIGKTHKTRRLKGLERQMKEIMLAVDKLIEKGLD